MSPVFITPKAPVHRSDKLSRTDRLTRRRLLSQDTKLKSGITANPSTWDPTPRSSPALLDDSMFVSETQRTISPMMSLPASQTDVTTVPESQVIYSPFSESDSLSGTPSLLALGTEHSVADESSLLVTSAMLPTESPSANQARTVSALILANQRIEELQKQIKELKAANIASVALQSLQPPSVPVPTKNVAPVQSDNEMLLFRASGRFTVLSNFFQHKMLYDGVLFQSAEHAYQHKKALFHGRREIATRVLRSRTPHLAKQVAKNIMQCKAWHDCKADIMTDILEEKAKQCPVFHKALQNTGTKHLVHNTETDSFWGCGEDFKGLNMLGSLLEDLRQRLHLMLPRAQGSRPSPVTTSRPTIPIPVRKAPSRTVAPPAVNRPKVLVLGNSNSRGVAQGLIDRGLDACGFTFPGGSISYVTSRIRHMRTPSTPDSVLLMTGDIEACDGLPAETIRARYEHLIKEARHKFPWSRLILSGLPQAGSNRRQETIRTVNSYLEAVAREERLIEFVSNARARLRDNIHLSRPAMERLCFNVSCKVKCFM